MFASPPHLSQHQRTTSPPPLSSSYSFYRNSKLKTSNPCNHRNQQYSIVGLTNAAGTLVERYSYSAYGTLGIYAANGTVRTTSTYANRYTYTVREYDADLNLYHFRARWYDPATGGFSSRDPLWYPDGMSLYRGYFATQHTDPTGLTTELLLQTVLENLVPKQGRLDLFGKRLLDSELLDCDAAILTFLFERLKHDGITKLFEGLLTDVPGVVVPAKFWSQLGLEAYKQIVEAIRNGRLGPEQIQSMIEKILRDSGGKIWEGLANDEITEKLAELATWVAENRDDLFPKAPNAYFSRFDVSYTRVTVPDSERGGISCAVTLSHDARTLEGSSRWTLNATCTFECFPGVGKDANGAERKCECPCGEHITYLISANGSVNGGFFWGSYTVDEARKTKKKWR